MNLGQPLAINADISSLSSFIVLVLTNQEDSMLDIRYMHGIHGIPGLVCVICMDNYITSSVMGYKINFKQILSNQ